MAVEVGQSLKPEGPCAKCHKHKATQFFVHDGGGLAFVHGFYESWCTHCVLEAQLEHAREAAARIPQLEAELAAVKCEEMEGSRET